MRKGQIKKKHGWSTKNTLKKGKKKKTQQDMPEVTQAGSVSPGCTSTSKGQVSSSLVGVFKIAFKLNLSG